jgi:hypothetical protein
VAAAPSCLRQRTILFDAAEYIEIMKDKELVLRTDVFEVVLAELESGAGGAASGDAPEGALQAS